METEVLKILYDHYKESYGLSKQAQNRRNRSFVLLCVLEAISFLILINPIKALALLTVMIQVGLLEWIEIADGWEAQFLFGNTVLQTLLWVLIVYVTVRYVQDVMYIERQYGYLDHLEKTIAAKTGGAVFNREGEHYLSNYPMILNFIDLFYKMFSPILFLSINTVRIYSEWVSGKTHFLPLFCDISLYTASLIIIWFYFFEIHSKITVWCKKHLPFVNTIAVVLRKILKAV